MVGCPKNCPLALMGRFPSSMCRFPTLMGRFPECLDGPFSLWEILWQQLIKKRGSKRFLISGPLLFRVPSRSRTWLRIVASISFSFRPCFKEGFRHYSTTIAWLSFLGGLEWGGWELLPVCACEIGRDRASQSHSLSQRTSYSGRGGEAEMVSIQPPQAAAKIVCWPP